MTAITGESGMDTGFKPLLLPGGPFWVWVGGGGGGGSGGGGTFLYV